MMRTKILERLGIFVAVLCAVAVGCLVVGVAADALGLMPREVRAAAPCVIPKSWGQVRAAFSGSYSSTILVFEAEDGTVRTVPINCKMPPAPIDSATRSAD